MSHTLLSTSASAYDFQNRSVLSSSFLEIISLQKQTVLSILLKKTLLNIEINNKPGILSCISNYLYLNKHHNIPYEQMRILLISLDKSLTTNITDIFYIAPTLKLMTKMFSIYKKQIDFHIDWKTYYIIYEMILKLSKTSSINLITEKNSNYLLIIFKFLLKAKKFFYYTDNDYAFIKEEVYRQIFSNKINQITLGLDVAKVFLPEKHMGKDKELQEHLFNLMIARKECMNSIISIFKQIIKINGDMLIDKATFINVFFELFMNYFSSSSNKISKSDGIEKSKTKSYKPRYTISYCMCWIFVHICTSNLYLQDYAELIDKNANIVVNFMNMNLGEIQSKTSNTILNVLVGIVICIKKLLFTKEIIYINAIENTKKYHPIDNNKPIVKGLIKRFTPLITKCLFYYENDATMLMEALMDVTETYEIDKEIFTVLNDLSEHSENNVSLFYNKMSSYVNVFFNKENINVNTYAQFIIKLIKACPGLITSAQEDQNIDVLFFISNIFCLINEKNDDNDICSHKNFLLIKQTAFDVCIPIVKRMLQLFDFISNNTIHLFFLDYLHIITKTNTSDNIESIRKLLVTYCKDNLIDVYCLSIYFLMIYYCNIDLGKTTLELWMDFMDKFTIKTSASHIKRNSDCLVNINFDQIDFILEEHKKSFLVYAKEFINCLEFKAFYNNDHIKTQINNVIALCLNSKDKRYKRIGIKLLSQVLSAVLTKKYDNASGIYHFPSENDIEMFNVLYNTFLKPYIDKFKCLNESYMLAKENDKDDFDYEIWIMETFEGEDEDGLIHLTYMLIRIMDVFTAQMDNPFLLDILQDTPSNTFAMYVNIRKTITSIKEFSLEIYPFLKQLKLLKHPKIHKYYLNMLLNDYIDQNKHSLEKYALCLKKVDLYYEHLNQLKLGLNEFLMHQYFVCAMLRYFKLNFDMKTLSTLNALPNDNVEYFNNNQLIIRKVKILSQLFISSIDDDANNNLFDYFYGINTRLTDDEWETLYKDIFTFILNKLKSTVSKPLSQNNKNKTTKLLYFYSTIITYALNNKHDLYAIVLNDFFKLIDLLKDDNSLDLALNILENKIMQKKTCVNISFTLISIRLNTLPSFVFTTEMRQIKTQQQLNNDMIYNQTLQSLLSHVDFISTKQTYMNACACNKSKVIDFLNEYLNDNFTKGSEYFNETTNQLIMIYLMDFIVTVCDPSIEHDKVVMCNYIKCLYSYYVKNEITTFALKKILISFLSFLFQVLYEVQFEFCIHKCTGNDVDMFYYKHPRNKIYVSDNKALFYIKKTKRIEINLHLIETYNDLKQLIIALLNAKDLMSDQQMIKISNEQSSTMTSINKHWECKMLFQLFNLNKNESVVNITNVNDIFTNEIPKLEQFDDNVISMIQCQITSGLIKNLIIDNRERYLQKEQTIPHNKVSHIQNTIKQYMQKYTNSQNKIIDNCIMKMLIYIIGTCTVEEFSYYFTQNNNNNSNSNSDNKFIYFDYGNTFALEVFEIVNSVFSSNRLCPLFNNSNSILPSQSTNINIKCHYELLKFYYNNCSDLIQKIDTVILLTKTMIVICKGFYYEPKQFRYLYNDNIIKPFFEELISLKTNTNDINNTEIGKIIIFNLYLLQKYFINLPSLLIEMFICIIDNSVLNSNSKNYYDIGLNFSISIPNETIKEYLTIINTKMANKQHELSITVKKYLVDFLINIIKANLYRLIQMESNVTLYLILSIMSHIDNLELKEYIMNNLLVFYMNSSTNKCNKLLVHRIKMCLLENKCDDDVDLLNIIRNDRNVALYVLGSFVKGFYLYMPEHIQDIIIFLRYLHGNIYKFVGSGAKLIRQIINEFIEKYQYSLYYVTQSMSEECSDSIRDLMNTDSYFS